VIEDGIGFAYERIHILAGETRVIEVWFDCSKIATETPVKRISKTDDRVRVATLSGSAVPTPASDGIAELRISLTGGSQEGRHELTIQAGPYAGTLPVHVRFPRTSGFISSIVLDDQDWPSGSALYDAASGRVTVYVGRPEFRDAAQRASRAKVSDPMKFPLYRQLVVESIREAALRPAAERRAEVEWDDLTMEERTERDAFLRLVLTQYNELDYELRGVLLRAFLEGVA